MGMIFNNWWEAFCRTYLELNGYFVQNNLFTDLHDLGESHPHEADIVAYKIPGTRIKFALDDPPDRRPGDEHVFWAGSEEAPLVYCEIRANFTVNAPGQAIKDLVTGEDLPKLKKKLDLVKKRFPGPDPKQPLPPTVVIMAEYLDKDLKQSIADAGWKYKTFDAMYVFMRRRFAVHGAEKLRILYNDPCLEMMRYLTIRRKRRRAQSPTAPDER